jgi:predicted O-methyltransferase YrrM
LGVLGDPQLEALLDGLHEASDAQIAAMRSYYAAKPSDEEIKTFRRDKLVALNRDKAEFCYQLCRATDARRIVDIGTSFGVSTLYLAAAVRDNIRAGGGNGVLIATEYEPEKARAARANFACAGVSDFIELRAGDLRETLKELESPVHFMLVDIWIGMAQPALELVVPYLRPGAFVICDNTRQYRNEYAAYFASLEAHGFRTMTLPFDGGLELSVYG